MLQLESIRFGTATLATQLESIQFGPATLATQLQCIRFRVHTLTWKASDLGPLFWHPNLKASALLSILFAHNIKASDLMPLLLHQAAVLLMTWKHPIWYRYCSTTTAKGGHIFFVFLCFFVVQSGAVFLATCWILEPKSLICTFFVAFGAKISDLLLAFGFWLWLLAFGFWLWLFAFGSWLLAFGWVLVL